MDGELDNNKNINEAPSAKTHFVLVKNWDRTIDSLRQLDAEELVSVMGFDLQSLVTAIIKEFPEGLPSYPVGNDAGEIIEDIITETISVNYRPLDRELVTWYLAATNPSPEELTKFLSGGEVIYLTDGEAEITYAPGQIGTYIPKSTLRTERVSKGDLIISTDTPNNWSKVIGDKFSFIYFVGNPNGPQKYSGIPKIKIPVK